MIRELKQALIVTQVAKSCLKLATFLLSLLLLVIYNYRLFCDTIHLLFEEGEERKGEGERGGALLCFEL